MSINISDEHRCSLRRGKPWHTYQYLEERLSRVSRFITFSQCNKETYSEELASLLILTGSAMDTFLRDMKECPYLKEEESYKEVHEKIEEKIKEGTDYPFWTIEDYRDAYNPIYRLSDNKIILPFGLEYYGEIQPFIIFNNKMVPKWWTAYNKMKHDYYESINKYANLDNVINMLGGLLILNVLHKCSQEYMVLYGFLKSEGNINPPVLVEELRSSKIGYPSPSIRPGLLLRPYIQTSQFSFRLRRDVYERKQVE